MAFTMIKNNAVSVNSPNGNKNGLILSQILHSGNIKDFLYSFSETINFTLHFYMHDGRHILSTTENPFCHLIKSTPSIGVDCPESCKKLMYDALKKKEPVTYKCDSMVINFSFPIERFGEKVIVVGRGGFATYEDLIEFLKICKSKNLSQIPVEMPLSFQGEGHALNVAKYLSQAVNCILEGFEERKGLEAKIKRLTSLLDNRTFETLSKNKELMYIYILDTIEFILGHTSTAMMVLEQSSSTYKTLYSTGRHKDVLKELRLDTQNPVIRQMLKNRSSVYPIDSSRLVPNGGLKDIEYIYLFPIYISDEIEGLIGIFDRRLTSEEIKIIKAFRDYIQVTLENQGLRLAISKKSEEILASLLDISKSIAPLLDTEHLFQTILEKSIQLLNAEQGSLMLLDHDTSELLVEARKGMSDAVRAKMRLRKGEGIAGKVAESGRPLLVEDIEKHPLISQVNRSHYKTKSFISMPIKIEDRVEGVINISDKSDGGAFNEYDLKLLESFTASAAIAIERSLFYKQTEMLKELSITDPLTGLYNRRHINERLKEEITRYKRYKHPFSFLMIDIDGFKAYNDTYGHIKGDQVLKILADTIASSLRTIDIAGRFGGDEFVVILSQTPKVDAISIANRLKEKANRQLSTFHVDDSLKRLTISMGLTTFPDDTSSIEDILERTDEALYLAKKGGGNRVSHI